ncbi:PASTA domain-containing protein [Micromonospora sp. WMMD735]|uniref:PASTA domain-containing protein n=1 Tax=Micromonospora sp. WMMD735 TaxID=3404130 RepID=UPI003B93CDEF
MLRRHRERLTQVGLVVGVLATVLVTTFGIGYRSSEAVPGDASTYVQKGQTVVRVNAESGEADARSARALATGRQRLEVVQVGPERVYMVNNETGETWRMLTDDMRPTRVDQAPHGGQPPSAGATPSAGTSGRPATGTGDQPSSPPSPAPGTRTAADGREGTRQLVTGGEQAYLLNPVDGTLALLDGNSSRPVRLPARVDDAVVDSHGTAWALSQIAGRLYRIDGDGVRDESVVSAPEGAVRLTLAGDRPVVYQAVRGTGGSARIIGDGSRGDRTVDLDKRVDAGAVRVAEPGAPLPVLVTLHQPEDTISVIDFRTGTQYEARLSGRRGIRDYGRPVVTGDRIYVPDHRQRQVIVLELGTLRQRRAVQVPGTGRFEVTYRDGRVWVNDPYARRMLVFDRDELHEVDKGRGDGVADDPAPTAPRTTPPRTTAPTVRPTTSAALPSPITSPRPTRSASPRPRPARTPQLVEVPQVAGKDQATACADLTAADLRCVPTTRNDPGCETGRALASVPEPGSRVHPRTQVTVFVCGPTVVPPVLGSFVDQACQAIQNAGLTCAPVEGGIAATPAEMGKVIGQSPEASSQVANRTQVTVTYLGKDRVTVPDVNGLASAAACERLTSLGFGCAPNPEEVTWDVDVVKSQDPAAGTAAAVPGTQVKINYQDTAAVHLQRFKVSGQDARMLSLDPNPQAGFEQQPAIGGAYPPNAQVAGLVDVYGFVCRNNCGGGTRDISYYYSQDPNPPTSRYESMGRVFRCFGSPVPGTALLNGMYSNARRAWGFAPVGSFEHDSHTQNGYTDQTTNICYIWFKVPPFRPNG